MKERRSERIKASAAIANDEWTDSDEENTLIKSNTRETSKRTLRLVSGGPPRVNPSEGPSTNLQIKLKVAAPRDPSNPASPRKKIPKEEAVIKLPTDMDPEPVCPICLKIIIGDLDDINEHVDECIGPSSSSAQMSAISTPSSSIPVSSLILPEADQKMSPCSLVNVDGEYLGYGASQYTEKDIERVAKSIASASDSKWEKEQAVLDAQNSLLLQSILNTQPPPSEDFSRLQVAIKSLLDRIAAAPKCAVCWETIRMPATISVNCWHVCCEECWLKTLGTKRLCPHCSTITNPSDLRKVFF